MKRKIVYKIEDDINPSEVYCTTYQMRNFYTQMADGFFSSLDIMNYIQHHAAVKRMKKGNRVLDVCCGRGLLLPLIRYGKPQISEYIGVDISEKNINEQLRRSGAKKIDNAEEYYPFKLTHIVTSVEDMNEHIPQASIDFIVYTSAIEHMQKEAGQRSLQNCSRLLKPGSEMFLSCPNTPDKQDPYDTQYAAHLYEWGLAELKEEVRNHGFEIIEEWGLVGKVKEFEKWMQNNGSSVEKKIYQRLKTYLPSPWLMALFPLIVPAEAASEVLLICKKRKKGGLLW